MRNSATLTRQQLLERQLEDVQRIGHVGVWELWPASRQLVLSDESCRMAGIAPGHGVTTMDVYMQVVHPDDRSTVLSAVAQAMEGLVPPVLAHRVIWPDGQVRHLLLRAFALRDEHGNAGLSGTIHDITARKHSQDSVLLQEQRFQIVARATTDIIWDWEIGTDQLWWSEGMHMAFGYTADEFDSGIAAWTTHIHPDDRQRVEDSLNAACQSRQEQWEDEYRFRRKNGSYAQVTDRGMFLRDEAGVATRLIGAMVDVTHQKEAEAERQRAEARNRVQASLLDKAHDGISATGTDGLITYWNKGAEHMFGWSAAEAMGQDKARLVMVDQQAFHQAYASVLVDGKWSGELGKRHKDGRVFPVESHLTLMFDDRGDPHAVLEIETDITRRKEAEREIEDLAFFDPLTSLPNRRLLLERLRHALAASRRSARHGALLFLDLDNFKTLNDTLGHDRGDLLLQQVARRLRQQVPRASDTVARHGGDEFVIVLEDLSDTSTEGAAHAELVAEKILASFKEPFRLEDHLHHTSPSIGIALFDQHIGNVDELLKRADLAMYQAKGAGRNTIRFFDPEMQTVISARVALEADLRDGLQRDEFCLHYQRQTDVSGRAIGAEALIRWYQPQRRWVAPAKFIPLAEETGLILSIGKWVLETACRQLVAWSRLPGLAHLTVAVNVSALQFRQAGFVEQVLEVLDATGADPQRLKLELTESLLVADVERTVDKMNALKARGIGFSLDDFGTGYSSLAYLKRLPLGQLKIDRSFVRDVLTDPNDAAIARTILGLGHTLGLDVIAEGVETASQRDFLAQNGCQSYQGYLFSRPVPAEKFR